MDVSWTKPKKRTSGRILSPGIKMLTPWIGKTGTTLTSMIQPYQWRFEGIISARMKKWPSPRTMKNTPFVVWEGVGHLCNINESAGREKQFSSVPNLSIKKEPMHLSKQLLVTHYA